MWDCKTSKMSQSPRAVLNAFGLFASRGSASIGEELVWAVRRLRRSVVLTQEGLLRFAHPGGGHPFAVGHHSVVLAGRRAVAQNEHVRHEGRSDHRAGRIEVLEVLVDHVPRHDQPSIPASPSSGRDLSLARRRYRSQTRRRPWQTLLRTSGIESSSPQGVRDTRRRPLHHRRLDLRHRRCRLGQPHHPCRLSLPPLLYRPRRRLRRRRSRRARRPVQTILVKARA